MNVFSRVGVTAFLSSSFASSPLKFAAYLNQHACQLVLYISHKKNRIRRRLNESVVVLHTTISFFILSKLCKLASLTLDLKPIL